MNTEPLVAIILTTWNHWSDSSECLKSLYKNSYKNFQTIVVDNNSTDETLSMLKKYYPEITVLTTMKNETYAESVNKGLKISLQKNADYSLFLNNDTIFDKNFLSKLVERAEADETIGIVASKMYFFDRPDVFWYAGGILDYKKGIIEHRYYGQKDQGQAESSEETGWCTGACTLYKNEMLKKIGLVDEEYEMYVSDVEHSVRAHKAGYKTWYEPSSIIWHKVSSTRKNTNPYKEYMKSRENMRFFLSESKWGAAAFSIRRTLTTLPFIKEYGIKYWFQILKGLFDGLLWNQ